MKRRRAATQAELEQSKRSPLPGLRRNARGNLESRDRGAALRGQAELGGVILTDGSRYELCTGCSYSRCQCRGDVEHIKSLAPSWDESHPDNARRTPAPVQETLI